MTEPSCRKFYKGFEGQGAGVVDLEAREEYGATQKEMRLRRWMEAKVQKTLTPRL